MSRHSGSPTLLWSRCKLECQSLLHHTSLSYYPSSLITIVALAAVRDEVTKFIEEHPALITVGAVVLIVAGGILVIKAVEFFLLLATGFGPLGPIKGECHVGLLLCYL